MPRQPTSGILCAANSLLNGERDSTARNIFVRPKRCYSASLFCPTGSRFLYGFVAKNGYEWVEYDVETAASKVVPLDDASAKLLKTEGLLVYGCNTLDDQSCGFVVGWKKIARGYGPFAFRVCW
jgi:hypothetical protein